MLPFQGEKSPLAVAVAEHMYLYSRIQKSVTGKTPDHGRYRLPAGYWQERFSPGQVLVVNFKRKI